MEARWAPVAGLLGTSVELATKACLAQGEGIASCKNNEVEPWAYLTDVFESLASGLPPGQLDQLLPDNWLIDHPQQRWKIAAKRREERKR
jgi:hypothetical protein